MNEQLEPTSTFNSGSAADGDTAPVGVAAPASVVSTSAAASRLAAESYVSQASWLDNAGRADLIDSIADDFERHRSPAAARRRAA